MHLYEQTFRLAALQAGLVLQAGTSPPVLERVKGLRALSYRHLAGEASPQFDVLRNHLRFFGPTTMADAAGYLDSPRKEFAAHWPADAEPIHVDGTPRSMLSEDLETVSTGHGNGHGPVEGVVRCSARSIRTYRPGIETCSYRTRCTARTCGGSSGGPAQ